MFFQYKMVTILLYGFQPKQIFNSIFDFGFAYAFWGLVFLGNLLAN